MSYSNFKPSLVLANLVVNFRKNLPGLAFCNTSITTGLKAKGTQLDINTLNDASANDVDEGTAMTYNELDTTNNSLTITLDKEVPVKIRDNDKVQIESSGQSLEAAIAGTMTYALADELDQLIFGKYTEITTDNFETGSTAWQWGASPTAAEIAKFFASVHKDMDDNDCPQQGRFIALPNIAIQGIRIAHGTVETVGGDAARGASTSSIGPMGGFAQVFQAPNVVEASSVAHGIAGNMPNVGMGVPGGIACAVQIDPSQIEKLRLEGFWADGIRVRITAGAKVYRPSEMVDINLDTDLLA